jgi:F0F1-type ATP synthase membrane subunit c/vacuolar-type H+-ATPase subunit K
LIFVKVAKCLSLSLASTSLGLCGLSVGVLFGSLLEAVAYCPDLEDSLFTYSMLGFALVETFMVLIIGTMGVVAIF